MSVSESEVHPAVVLADVVDTAHLARYTMGDEKLERELLRMFATQLDGLVTALESARGNRDWKQAAHGLKGAARAIGAFPMAELAAAAEAAGPRRGRSMLADIRRQAETFRDVFARWEADLLRHSA
ncbi:MAG TPA: Hpt domain-containing protein [Thermopetrobacter sp.]|nr:Hpt domain-containing protein [Thermopetrobacter sp.]